MCNKNIRSTNELLLQQEADHLQLPDLNHIYKDVKLPVKGKSGCTIHWESSDPFLLSPDGIVYRPDEKDGKKTVTLTAELTCKGIVYKKTFNAVILPEYKHKKVTCIPFLRLETEPGINPVLPNFVWIEYNDGTKKEELVIWEAIPEGELKKKGNFTLKGHLKQNSKITVPAYISVKYNSIDRPQKGSAVYLTDVNLIKDTIFTQNNKRTLDYLKLLDPDRMLYSFRSTFHMDTKNVKPLGGWEEPIGLLRGHSTGHFLSALALAYSSTGDREIKEKLDYVVNSLKELQDLTGGTPSKFKTQCTKENADQSLWGQQVSEWGKGYLSAYPPDQFALLEIYTPYPTIWAPYYTYHKLLAGLLNCYEYAQSNIALTIACKMADWVYDRLMVLPAEQLNKMWSMYIAGEYGGMNESLSQLYLLTGNLNYLKASLLFDNHKVFEGLAKNKDSITSLHANQHIPQMIGALKEYEATSEIQYYLTAYYFWHLVTKHYAYSIGGVGRSENFKEIDILAGNIDTDRNCETCAAYNMLKLTKALYRYEPENSEYMDYYEKTLYNQIIASQNPIVTEHMHHGVTYMLPIGPGQHKEYGTDYEEFTCCHGTGMENHVKYQENIYFLHKEENKIYINLYIPSILHSAEIGTILTISGEFPGEKTTITIKSETNITCCFRIPHWCRTSFRLMLNGKEIPITETESSYVCLSRTWSDNDKLDIYTPYEVALEYTPDDLDLPVASIMYGPFVMVAPSSIKDWITLILSPKLRDCFRSVWKKDKPVLYYDDLEFIPIYAAHHMDYHTYFKIKIPYAD